MPINLQKDTLKRNSHKSQKTDLSSMALGKVPPQARELEEAILGAIMLESDKLPDVLEILPTPECFYVQTHQLIYEAIKGLSERGDAVDLLTVSQALQQNGNLEQIGGQYALTRLTMAVVSSAHVVAHARIVLEKFILRELIKISSQTISKAFEDSTSVFDLMDEAESGLFEISNNFLRKNYASLSDILVETMEQIAKSKEEQREVTGVTSGFPSLDKITAGWQNTDLIILAARPSVGKTALALNFALNAALSADRVGVAVFSLEMGNVQLVKRLLSTVTDIPLEKISRGNLDDRDFKQLTERMDRLAQAPIFIDDQAGLNIFELRAKCRRLKAKHNIGLILIDYLQLMTATLDNCSGNREQEISKISRELKGLAKELNIPVIALSQLNRSLESRSGSKVPQLSDLRESGAIEQDADMVMFIYRPAYHDQENDTEGKPLDGETHIHIAKHRNGRLGNIMLKAELEYQRFIEPPSAYLNNFGTWDAEQIPTPENYQTIRSKASDITLENWDDDDSGLGGSSLNRGFSHDDSEDEAPF